MKAWASASQGRVSALGDFLVSQLRPELPSGFCRRLCDPRCGRAWASWFANRPM